MDGGVDPRGPSAADWDDFDHARQAMLTRLRVLARLGGPRARLTEEIAATTRAMEGVLSLSRGGQNA